MVSVNNHQKHVSISSSIAGGLIRINTIQKAFLLWSRCTFVSFFWQRATKGSHNIEFLINHKTKNISNLSTSYCLTSHYRKTLNVFQQLHQLLLIRINRYKKSHWGKHPSRKSPNLKSGFRKEVVFSCVAI